MAINIGNLTAEEKAMILKAGKDGFSAEELRELGLNKQNAEALYKQLAGEAEEVGDKATFSSDIDALRAERDRLNQEIKDRKQQYKYEASAALREGKVGEWVKNAWRYELAPDGLYKEAKSPLAAALPFVMALLTTAVLAPSCSLEKLNAVPQPIIIEPEEKGEEKDGMTVIVNVDIDFNINVSQNMDINAFIALFNNIVKQLEGIKDQLVNMEASILATLEHQGLSLNEIKILLTKMQEQDAANAGNILGILERIDDKLSKLGEKYDKVSAEQNGKLDRIIAELEKANYSLKDIVALLKEKGKTDAEILAALKENNKDIKEILKAMSLLYDLGKEQNSIISEKIDNIVKLLEKNIVIDQATQDFVFKVLDAVNNLKLEGGTFDTANIEKALAALLDVVKDLPTKDQVTQMNDNVARALNNLYSLIAKFMEQDKAMDEVTQKQIADLTALISKFMAKEGEMDAKMLDLMKQVLAKIENLKFEAGDVTVNVDLSKLEAMMSLLVDKVGTLEGGVKKLIELALAGNENMADLVKVVQAFKDETHADLGDIKKLIKAVKEGVDKNGNTLLSIDEKLDIVNLTLKELKEQYPNISTKLDEIIKQLGDILAKIPEGHECKCDPNAILARLDIIITKLENDPSNEGIVDDLEDLLK